MEFTSTTLAQWMIKVSEELFAPLLVLLDSYLLQVDYLHADETRVQLLDEPARYAWQKSYFWVRVTGTGPPIIRGYYAPSHAGAVAERLLSGFNGYLQSDAYSSYNGVTAREALAYIRRLYQIEKAIKGLSPEERPHRRQTDSQAVLDEFARWCERHLEQAAAFGGARALAFGYLDNQREALTRFVEDEHLQLDNNRAERHIHPIATAGMSGCLPAANAARMRVRPGTRSSRQPRRMAWSRIITYVGC